MTRRAPFVATALSITMFAGAACSAEPDALTFSDGDGPVATVAQTTTTLQSVDLNVDFMMLQAAFRDLNENPAATTTIEAFDPETGDPTLTYQVSYVPRSQWRHATMEYVSSFPDTEAYIDLDGNVVMPVDVLFDMKVWIENRDALEAADPDGASEPGPDNAVFQRRSDLESIEGFAQYNDYEILHSLFLVEAAPGPLVTKYVIENPIVADRGEIRVVGEVDETAEFEVVPNADEPGRYYVMRLDLEGRITMVDSRLAGIEDSVVVHINYDVAEAATEPPATYLSTDELLEAAGELDTWAVPIASGAGE